MMGGGTNQKHVEQFPDKINYVMLHLVGYILEYYYDAQTQECHCNHISTGGNCFRGDNL
jgi:hypothetical protein